MAVAELHDDKFLLQEVTLKCKTCSEEFTTMKIFSTVTSSLCDSCLEVEREKEAERQEAERKIRLENRWRVLCPEGYRESDLSELPDDLARDKYKEVLAWQPGRRGLIIHGANRRGKTRAAWSLIQRLFFEGRSIVAFDCASFGYEISNAFLTGDGEKVIYKILAADIIFFDDLGQMVLTPRVQESLLVIMERRMSQRKPIIFTTNEERKKLAARFEGNRGEAFVSRMVEFCDVIWFAKPGEKK